MHNGLPSLHAFLLQLVQIDDPAWHDMQECLQLRSYKKREHFVTEGKMCREIGFATRGSFRYYKTIDGIEITTFFTFDNSWVSAYTSFLNKTPSFVTVEAMEDAEVLILNHEQLQQLYKRHGAIERFGRLMAEYLVTCLDERMHSLLLKTPEERYLKTMKDNSIYFERVPQHYIASYLGIAPESLSRIRKRLTQKHFS
jgi:CRP-like cAMP-binding protein